MSSYHITVNLLGSQCFCLGFYGWFVSVSAITEIVMDKSLAMAYLIILNAYSFSMFLSFIFKQVSVWTFFVHIIHIFLWT